MSLQAAKFTSCSGFFVADIENVWKVERIRENTDQKKLLILTLFTQCFNTQDALNPIKDESYKYATYILRYLYWFSYTFGRIAMRKM